MRIALVLPGLSIGGTEKMVFHLALGLRAMGHDTAVACLKEDGPYGARLRDEGILCDILHTPNPSWRGALDFCALAGRLRQTVEKFRPQIVHSFLTRANFITRWALRGQASPQVVCAIRTMEKQKKFHLWAERLYSKPPVIFTANSKALKDFATRVIGIDQNQIEVIYNGVSIDRSPSDDEISSVRRTFEIEDKFIILSAGRLQQEKGYDLLIRAFSRVIAQPPRAILLIAGEGSEKRRLQADIKRLHLTNQVRLIGEIKDLTPFFKIAHLFVLSSRWEGTPNVVLEAMAAGCPVVATRVGGVSEILSAPEEGLVVEPEDTQALEKAMAGTLGNPQSAQQRAAKALARSKEFSMEKMVDAHLRLYNRLLA